MVNLKKKAEDEEITIGFNLSADLRENKIYSTHNFMEKNQGLYLFTYSSVLSTRSTAISMTRIITLNPTPPKSNQNRDIRGNSSTFRSSV